MRQGPEDFLLVSLLWTQDLKVKMAVNNVEVWLVGPASAFRAWSTTGGKIIPSSAMCVSIFTHTPQHAGHFFSLKSDSDKGSS